VLLRITLVDDREQAAAAAEGLKQADVIAITLPTLCEFSWTLRRAYRKTPAQVASAIRHWAAIEIVDMEHAAVEAGLRVLDSGGDFADGVIAFEGRRLGGEIFLTFDRKAASLLEQLGQSTRLLETSARN